MQETFQFNPEFAPRFNVGDTVWYLWGDTGKYDSTEVRNIMVELYPSSGFRRKDLDLPEGLTAICTGYKVGIWPIWLPGYRDYFLPREVFASEEEAKIMAKWYPIEEEYDWESLLGDREKETHHEAELALCCASISAVRNCLYMCKENGGVIERERQTIIANLSSHPEILEDAKDFPNLNRLFAELDIKLKDVKTWEEDEEDG